MIDYPADRNIVITGFMGTGKTTVAHLLAQSLSRPFFDMDTLLEERFGKPISQVFAEDGEAAFRSAETELCERLAAESGIVVSTGGGALVSPQNRRALAESGILICLTAGVNEILRRLDNMHDRPLLPGTRQERAQRIHTLLEERGPAYAAIRHHLDTDGRSPAQVVDNILFTLAADLELSGMTLLPVRSPEGNYEIGIGTGLLDQIGFLLANRGLQLRSVAVVSNEEISTQYYARLRDSLTAAGFTPFLCTVPDGERYKTLDTVRLLYEAFLENELDRNGAVIALGGGVIGDLAGFAAATYLRGVAFIQAPTSLLSMVDASVGGKTGVDLPEGKNLVGAFKQPQFVAIDTDVLETLPAPEFRSGLAEIIKHGIIGAPDMFAQLEGRGPGTMAHLIASAVRVKIDVVEEDPYETGRRAVLNLGHTFGHAVELVSSYSIRHGEGVALGLIAAAELAQSTGMCDREVVHRIRSVVEQHELPVRTLAGSVDDIVQAMRHDKKRRGKTLRFIIPRRIGDVMVVDNPGWDEVRAAVNAIVG